MPQGGKLKSNPHKAKSTTQKKQQPKKGRQSPSLSLSAVIAQPDRLSPLRRTSDPAEKGSGSIASDSPQGELAPPSSDAPPPPLDELIYCPSRKTRRPTLRPSRERSQLRP
jgi:hypothetical protein